MQILVTGAAGYGGAAIIRRLADQGHDIVGVDMVAPEEAWRLRDLIDGRRIEYRWQAVQDMGVWDVAGYDRILHMAAVADVAAGHHSPEYTVQNNVLPTVHLLELVRQLPDSATGDLLLILAGTAHELEAAGDVTLTEDSPIQPGTPYGFSKATQELAFRTWGHAYGVPWAIMRNGIVAGRGMRRQIAPYLWCRRILQDMPVELHGRGLQTRDLTDGRDTAEAWARAVESPASKIRGQVLQVSRGIEITVADMLEMCYQACEHMVDHRIARRIEHGPDRPGEEGMRERFDCSRTRALLDWVPRYNPSDTIADVAAWAAEGLGLPVRASA